MPNKQNNAPIKASTQEFLEIEDIQEGIVILKDGSAVLVMSTTAINFGLLSEKEQDASIYAYGALLNSLTFPVQILIRSKRKDITSYLNLLTEQEKKLANKTLKNQLRKYHEFIESTVSLNNVLEKQFYLIIPMSSLEIGVSSTVSSKLKRGRSGLPYPKEYIIEKAKTNLYPKRDHLFRLMSRLGLRSRQLTSQELVQLFFEIYNPDIQGQVLGIPSDYQTPLVKPAATFMPAPTTGEPAPSAPVSATGTQITPAGQPVSTPTETIPPAPNQPAGQPPANPVPSTVNNPVPTPLVPKPQPAPANTGPQIVVETTEKPEDMITEIDHGAQNEIDQLVESVTKPKPTTPIFDANQINNQPTNVQT